MGGFCWLLIALGSATFGASASTLTLKYSARLDASNETLVLRVCGAPGAQLELYGRSRFVTTIEPAAQSQTSQRIRLTLPDHGCARITTDLRAAGDADRYRLGRARGLYYRLAAEQWFWRPQRLTTDSRLRLRLPQGWSASLPWATDSHGEFRLGSTPESWPALTVFARFDIERVAVPGGELRLAILPLGETSDRAAIRDWLVTGAQRYFAVAGGLPVDAPQVFLAPLPGVTSAVPWGEIQRGGAPAVHLYVGIDAGSRAWREDWTLAHELAHLQHPFLGDRGRWLAEGLASYHQNIWRSRTGELSPNEAWRRLLAGFARGRAADSGTALGAAGSGWGSTMRVYWSGAAFWFESDLALRSVGASLDQVLQQYRANGLALNRTVAPDEFIEALHAMAPGANLARRYRQYAALTDFPTLTEASMALALPPAPDWPGTLPDQPALEAIFKGESSQGVATQNTSDGRVRPNPH